MPIVIGDVFRTVVACYNQEAKQQGLFRVYHRAIAIGGAEIEDIPLAFKNKLKTVMRSWLPQNCRFAGCSTQKVYPLPRSGTFYSLDGGVGTSSSLGPLPTQASGLIRYRTAGITYANPAPPPSTLSSPGTHGRSYIPFPGVAWFDAPTNELLDTAVTKLQSIADRLGPIASIATTGLQLQQVIAQGPNLFQDVVSNEVSYQVATQRRRGSFGQLNKAFGG